MDSSDAWIAEVMEILRTVGLVEEREARDSTIYVFNPAGLGSVGIQDSHPGLVVIQAWDEPIRFD